MMGLIGCSNSPTSNNPDLTTAAPDLAGGGFKLTLKNYLAWCDVTVDGSAPSTANQTLTFPAGHIVNLTGDKASATFVWGYWRGTTGDSGSTPYDTSMNGTVVMSQDRTVQACCPFANAPNTPCPAP